jgi:hypothetical protein
MSAAPFELLCILGELRKLLKAAGQAIEQFFVERCPRRGQPVMDPNGSHWQPIKELLRLNVQI